MQFFARSLAIACLLAGFAMVQALPVAAQTLGFSKAFSPATVVVGQTSRLTYTIDNTANSIVVGSLAFTIYNLLPGMTAATPLGLELVGCGNPAVLVQNRHGTARVRLSGGVVAAGGTCTISFNVRPSLTGTRTSTSSELTSDLPEATPGASATLTVNAAPEPLVFSKAFSPATVDPGEISRLTYTIDNTANSIAVASLAFRDFFPSGLSLATAARLAIAGCGSNPNVNSFNQQDGRGRVFLSGGTVAAGGTCTISVDVRGFLPGTLTSTSGELTSDLPEATPGARATLTVNEAPLSVSMSFSPAVIEVGGISRLSYELRNDEEFEARLVSLSDTLPDGVVVADPPEVSTTCTLEFADLSARPGGLRVAYSDGRVGALSTCTIAVNVTSARAGSYLNPTEEARSSLGTSTPAEALLVVTTTEPPLSVSMSFSPTEIRVGRVSTLSYLLRNGASVEATEVSLFDTLPDGVVVASPANLQRTCTGGSQTAGGRDISYAGGTLGAGADCMISVDVTSATVGSYRNDTESVTSSLGDSLSAGATLMVNDTEPPLLVSMSFSPARITAGSVSRLTYEIRNDATVGATSISLSDDLPENVLVAADPDIRLTNCNTAGALTGVSPGGAGITWNAPAHPAGVTCTISINVTSALVGSYLNRTEEARSSLGLSPSAEATLTVDPAEAPVFTMAFSPATVDLGEVSRLTFTIDNTENVAEIRGLAFDDGLPGLVVAAPPNASTTCGGTFAPAASATSLAFSGGRVAAGQTCTLAVDLQAVQFGILRDSTSELTSNLPVTTAPGATATLMVNAGALSVSMAFEPPIIRSGGVSRLTYELRNEVAIGATEVALSDTLPDGVVVASPANLQTGSCTFPNSSAGGSAVSVSGGSLAAGAACTITVDVTAFAAGSYPNSTEDVTSSLGFFHTPAEATLTVNAADAPGFARVFSPDIIPQGGETEMVFTIDNGANAIAATGMAFDAVLPSGVSVPSSRVVNDCGGTLSLDVSSTTQVTTVSLSGGTLAASATCEIRVTVLASEAGTLTGPAVDLRSSIATGTTAEATLTVVAATAPVFSKAFSPATVDPGEASTLTFTIDNTANLIDVGGLAFEDRFPLGMTTVLPPNARSTCRGRLVDVDTAFLPIVRYSGGRVAAGQSCTLSVDVEALVAGELVNVSGDLTSDLPVATPGVSATLTVNEVPLTVSMSFEPPTIVQGRVSRLIYRLENGAAAEATLIALSDTLPAGVVVAGTANAGHDCAGSLRAAAGGREVSYSGGFLVPGDVCRIAVNVTSVAAGSYLNSTESATSLLGTSTPAEATLTVDLAAPGFASVFSPDRIEQGGETEIVFTVDNTANPIAMTEMAFDASLPSGVSVSPTRISSGDCGGTLSVVAGATTLGFSGGTLAAGATCELRVTVRALEAGTLTGPEVDLTSSIATATAAGAMLTVDPAPPPVFSKAFSPAAVDPGGVSTLTFTIDNTANLIDVGSLAFDDDFPDGMRVAGTPNAANTCGGTLTAHASFSDVMQRGGAVAAGQTCTISVDVRALRAGPLMNVSGELTSDLADAAPGAPATLTVREAPLSVSMSFVPAMIDPGGVSRLTYRLENGSEVAATSVDLSDTLPDGVVLADPPNVRQICAGGTLTAAAGDGGVSYSGGGIVGGVSCTIAVDVTSAAAGIYLNGTESVTSSLGTSTPAEAILTVGAAAAPVFSKAFSPDTVDPGGESTLTFTIDNTANAIDVGSLAFTDDFPDGLVMTGTPNASAACGALATLGASETSLTFSDGSIVAGQTCTISVEVGALRAGTLENLSGDLTSDLPDAAPGASATLTVNEMPLQVRLSFLPSRIEAGGVSRLTYVLDNEAQVSATSVSLSDTLPTGIVVASEPNAQTTCGGTLLAPAGGGEISLSGGSVNDTCTISVDVTSAAAGSYPNIPESGTSSLGTSRSVETTLTVDPAVAPGFTQSFSPDTVDPGGISRLTFTIDNTANLIDVGGLQFVVGFVDGLAVAGPPNASTTCGGTLIVSATSLPFFGGSVAAGQTCTISVDVLASRAGALTGMSSDLTSDLPVAAPGASATLTVREAPLSVSMSFAPPTIDQGGVSRLTYVLRNGAAVAAADVALSDSLPADVVLAPELNANNGCGGVLSATPGGVRVSYSRGSLGAGATCTIAVDVTSVAIGSHLNNTERATSSLGTSTAASATLTVDAVDVLGFAKAFSPDTVDPGGISRLTYTIDNGANAFAVGSLGFSDFLPGGVAVAAPFNPTLVGCGNPSLQVRNRFGDGMVQVIGGSVAANGTCRISIDVLARQVGALTGMSNPLTSDLPVDVEGASATLTVNEAPLSVSMSFEPSTIDQGGVSRLTYRLENGAVVGAVRVALSDRLPADVVLAPELNADNGCGGFLSVTPGGVRVSYSDGLLVAGATCTIAVDVTSAADGSHLNGTESATSSLGTSTVAEATLTVDPAAAPGFARVFLPDTIRQGGETEIVFTVDNGANAIAMTGMAFADSLPSGVSVADTPGTVNGCGGTFSPVAGATTLAFTGGALAAGATCELRVTVRALEAGTLTSPAVDLTSNIATASAAEATLTVDAVDALGFAKAFSPATVDPGGVSRLTYRIDNSANAIEVGSLAFTDAFPDGLAVAGTPDASTTCGGTFAPAASATSLVFTGGRVAAGQSCELSVDVVASRAGALTGTSGDLTSDLPGDAPGVEATLTVNEPPLSVSMSFEPLTIRAGGVSRLTYVLRNGAAVGATSVTLFDRLPADVVLAPELNQNNGCGGFLSATPGGGRVSYSRGSLGVDAACTIAVDVTSAAVGRYPNETERVTSTHGDSTPASATLTVEPAAAPGFAKAFSPGTVDLGGISRLTYTIDNTANLIDVGGLAFDDDFPDGLAVAGTPDAATTCGGTFAPAASATSLVFTGGRVAAGQSCELSVDVVASRAGALTGTSGDLTSDLPGDAPGVEATLTVNEPPLSVSMSFEPLTIRAGGVSRLTYVLRNGAAVGATSVTLFDRLPADVVLAPELNQNNGCGGFLSATPGGGRVSYSRGSLGVDAACTIAVDVTSAAVGRYPNETERVTSTHGDSTPASATLTVEPAAAPGFAKAFSPGTVDLGGISRLTYTIDNTANLIDVGGLAFDDDFPDGLAVAGTPDAATTCGGTFAPAASATSLVFTGGRVAAGQSCELSVDVVASRAGALTGTSGDLTSDLPGDAPGVEATLTVNEPPLSVSMSFEPLTIRAGGVSRLTYVLRNGAAVGATSVTLFDRLPADVVLAPELNQNNGCGGFLSATPGGGRVSYSRGSLGVDAACTIAVDVTSAAVGRYPNETERVTSTHGDSTPASATLTVEPAAAPGFAKAFSPGTVDLGGISRLTYTIDNTANLIDVGGLAFDDDFPDGLAVAGTPDAATTCGGTFAPAASATSLVFTGGRVAAGQSCELSVDVVASRAGALTGTSGDLTSDLPGDAPGVEATLTVNEPPLSVSMSFEPLTIRAGGVSRLTYVLRNGAAVGATSVTLFDRLPADVVLAPELNQNNGCGGFLSATPGGGRVSYSRGSLGVDAACTIAVDVTSAAVGRYPNETERVTSTHGDSTPASATLTVEPAAAPGFAKAFSPGTVDLGGISRLTYTIDNTANLIDVGGLAFDDDFPDGLAVAGTPDAATTCGGTFAPAASATSLVFTGGRVAAGQSCELSVDVVASRAGALTGTSGDLTSDLPGDAPGVEATLTVNEPPLSVSMSFEPLTIRAGGVSRLTYVLRNGAAVGATSVTLFDRLPADVVLAPELNQNNGCGGFLSATPGGGRVSYSRGSLGVDAACTIAVDVT